MNVCLQPRGLGSLGWPWSLNQRRMPGLDVYPDGCRVEWDYRDGVLIWKSGCTGRAPLTDQDLDWIDSDGVRHAGLTQAERDMSHKLYGGNQLTAATTKNEPMSADQLAEVRAALGLPASAVVPSRLEFHTVESASEDIPEASVLVQSKPAVEARLIQITSQPDSGERTAEKAVDAYYTAPPSEDSGIPWWIWAVGIAGVVWAVARWRG